MAANNPYVDQLSIVPAAPQHRFVGRPPALMLGVPISDVTMAETLALIDEMVHAGRATGRTHQISTVNVDFLVNAIHDEHLARILQQSDLCIADGMPIVWGTRALGMPVSERVAGADLVPLLVAASELQGWRIHVFGSLPAVADQARTLLRERHPRADFTIDAGPHIRNVDDVAPSVLDGIRDTKADILCVALGNPKQERFIAAHRERLGIPVMIGVGGALDMLVGRRRRAPKWMQSAGLEWIARAVQEPRRLGTRYARDARIFGPALLKALWQCSGRRSDSGLQRVPASDRVAIEIAGARPLGDEEWAAAAADILAGLPLVIHPAPDSPASDRAVAQLIGLISAAHRGRSEVVWMTDDGRSPGWLSSLGFASHAVFATGVGEFDAPWHVDPWHRR